MSALLDVIAAMFFGSTLFVIVLTSNDIASETQTVYNGDMLVQEMLTETVQLLEGEFRNMGYGVPQGINTVMFADSTTISFLTDLARDGGIPDTVTYYLGDTTELHETQNEMDRFLYRRVNSSSLMKVGVVTAFHLSFYAQSGELLPTPVPTDRRSEIYNVEMSVEVQNPYAPYRSAEMIQTGERNALYSSSLWQQTRLASQNFRR
jgi:hypothetical protein